MLISSLSLDSRSEGIWERLSLILLSLYKCLESIGFPFHRCVLTLSECHKGEELTEQWLIFQVQFHLQEQQFPVSFIMKLRARVIIFDQNSETHSIWCWNNTSNDALCKQLTKLHRIAYTRCICGEKGFSVGCLCSFCCFMHACTRSSPNGGAEKISTILKSKLKFNL